ncbi:hypothetical protein [Variovorax sp. LG9.2]|uniref:hypothetical protein n=1 Tax=Variovorax sp. LG9.2 TaxID=3048626 RepID=UPI002B22212C|nr:hypothetical protein [Variovorax sp. LG9.2]MEB0058814.1 hypothetical protein [Variovorax sp. LG9.2]
MSPNIGQEPSASSPDDKAVANVRAQFALKGFVMTESRNADGRATYQVSRWGECRVFTHQHDLCAFLRQVTGVAA